MSAVQDEAFILWSLIRKGGGLVVTHSGLETILGYLFFWLETDWRVLGARIREP